MNLSSSVKMPNKRITLADGRWLQVGALIYRLPQMVDNVEPPPSEQSKLLDEKRNENKKLEQFLLIKQQECEILLVTSRGRGRWIIPKGWPMKGRTLPQSALQEAYEEAGVRGFIHEESLGSYHYQKKDMAEGKNNRFHVMVFAILYQRQKKKWPEQGQRHFEWVTPLEASKRVEETNLKEILRQFTPPVLHSC